MMISKPSLQVQRSPFAGFIEIILKTRLTVSGERREDESLAWYSCWSLKVLNPYCFKGQKTMKMWNAQIRLVNQRCYLLFLKPQFWIWKKTKKQAEYSLGRERGGILAVITTRSWLYVQCYTLSGAQWSWGSCSTELDWRASYREWTLPVRLPILTIMVIIDHSVAQHTAYPVL